MIEKFKFWPRRIMCKGECKEYMVVYRTGSVKKKQNSLDQTRRLMSLGNFRNPQDSSPLRVVQTKVSSFHLREKSLYSCYRGIWGKVPKGVRGKQCASAFKSADYALTP